MPWPERDSLPADSRAYAGRGSNSRSGSRGSGKLSREYASGRKVNGTHVPHVVEAGWPAVHVPRKLRKEVGILLCHFLVRVGFVHLLGPFGKLPTLSPSLHGDVIVGLDGFDCRNDQLQEQGKDRAVN